MHCCPQGSWPQLDVDYLPEGETWNIEGVTTYHKGSGTRALLIVEDIFGIYSGRHQAVADLFASKGYNVFMPEFLDPCYKGPIDSPAVITSVKSQSLQQMEGRFCKVVAHLKTLGIEKFLSIGICWGAWFAFKMAAKYDNFIAIAAPHPSLRIEKIYGRTAANLAEQIKCPAYFLPAGNDPLDVKEKGEVVEVLARRFGSNLTGSTHFPEMIHGWVMRGDLKHEKVSRDVHKALLLIEQYLARFK
jgi:dienelactone hydrolase